MESAPIASVDLLAARAREAAMSISQFVRVILNCAIHGPLHWAEAEHAWICCGFDGEGCPNRWEPDDDRGVTARQ